MIHFLNVDYDEKSGWSNENRSIGPEAQIAPVAAQQVARVLQKHGERLGGPGLDVIREVSRHPPG